MPPEIDAHAAPDQILLDFEGQLDAAAQEGVLRGLPTSAEEFTVDAFAPGQLRAVYDRLYRLGYLASRDDGSAITGALRDGIRLFQTETGLTVDGWLGEQSWQALQELFTFAEPTTLRRWYQLGIPMRALGRAVNLRLFAFGLLYVPRKERDNWQSEPMVDVHALNRWSQIWRLLGDTDVADRDPLGPTSLARMFDLDTLLRDMTAHRRTLSTIIRDGGTENGKLVRTFVNCYVQIELWLIGHKVVRPIGIPLPVWYRRYRGGISDRRRSHSGASRHHYSPMLKELRAFWRRQGLQTTFKDEALALLRTVDGLATLNAEDGDRAAQRRTVSTEVIGHLDKLQEGGKLARQWNKRSLGSRIWDGVKRTWRYVVSVARRIVGWFKEVGGMLVDLAIHAAHRAYSVVRRAIVIFADAADWLFRREVEGSSADIAMYRQKDFDFKVWRPVDGNRDSLEAFLRRLEEKQNHFHIACVLLGVVVRMAMGMAKLPAGPWGWWKLLRALIASYGEIRELDLQEISTVSLTPA